MRKLIYVILFTIIIMTVKIRINASSRLDLCVVYEKLTYDKGDVVSLSFDLPKFSNLFEVIIRIEYDQNSLIPIASNDQYYKLNNHSIFDNFVVNKKINDNTIYAELMKSDVTDGYYSSYRNNLCTLEFHALKYINNIEEYFTSSNVQIFLFDINHQLITYDLKLIKQLDAGFNEASYDVCVNGEKINLSDIFYVNNRLKDEYMILEEKTINYEKIGTQILQIGVFDIVTGKYQSYSTIINVLDYEAPIILSKEFYDIKDTELDSFDFLSLIEVNDNYDENVNIMINYYNKEYIKTTNFLETLKNDLILIIGFVAVDSSLNKSEEIFVKINLIDTTCPVVNASDIKILDKNIDEFEITDYISINDELDSNPKLVITFYNYNLNLIDDLKEYLTVNQECYADISGIDKAFNTSEKVRIKLSLVDTTPPLIISSEVNHIIDTKLDNYEFEKLIVVSDNDLRKCNISYDFIVDDLVIGDVGEFRSSLVQKKQCFIKYYVYDYSLNYSSVLVEVVIKDTTNPVINVNLKDGEIYKKIDVINYEITDNISNDLEVKVLLDGSLYEGGKVSDGKHELYISAIDDAGNKCEYRCSFIVSDKSFVGNLFDGNIKLKSSLLVGFVVICSFVIGIIKYRNNYCLKKKYQES